MYKTRLCNHWVTKGSCPRADRCVYARGSAELRPSQAPSVVRGQHGATPSLALSSSGQSSASAKVPEVVFTVDKEEERRRAERAKRFAPRQKASFEAEEKAPPPEPEPVEAEGAAFDDMGLNEDQIADYLFEMQQQMLHSMDDGRDGGFDFVEDAQALGQGLACIASCVALAASDGRGRGGDGKARRWRQTSPFTAPMSKWRGQTGRGKKGHFHLLDRYIRRIDALLPEDMEDLVRPLSYKPNMEQTTRTLKITFPDETVKPDGITEQDVRDFMYPLVPEHLALGWYGEGGTEVYAMFETNEECRNGRRLDGQRLGGHYAQVRFTVDNKFRRVMEDLGHWPKSGDQEEMPPEADQLEVAG